MQLKDKLFSLLIAVIVFTLQSGIFASDTASVVLTKRPASFFQHKELIGASSTRISGTDKGVNITFTDPYSSSSMTRFAGTYKATIDGNSGSMYCIDIVHPIAKYSESQPHVYTDNGSTPSTITYILNNCYPNKSYPYTGSAGSVDNEAASVQAAIWHYSDGLDISKITNSTIKTRATKIISDCDSHSSEVSILTSFNIVPADQTITNYSPASVYAKAIDASGNAVSGLTVNFSTTYGTLSSSSAVTGSNGQTSAITLTKEIPNNATITATTSFSFPQGTKFEESSGPNDYQKLVLATPTTANREAIATVNWQISNGNCSTTGFITYTQGGWGGSGAPGTLRDSKFSTVFPSGLVIGGTKTAKFTSSSAINNYLPAGGTASYFTTNYTNPSSTSAGVLGGQAVALMMNINFNNAGLLGTNATKFGDMIITSGSLAGKTVNELANSLNIALGGSSTPYSITDLNATATSVNENFDNGTVDKGFLTCPAVVKGSIGDKVWNDANHNGIQDNGESGISGVTANLYDCNGNLKATTTTDANGIYSFTDVIPGSYNVGFALPSGYAFTTLNAGSDRTVDSEVDPSTGKTACFTLASGENATKYDAGMYFNKGSIGDKVWNDANYDGLQNNNESGIPGITVKLYTSAAVLVSSTTTDINGNYSFKDQTPGSYYISVTSPSGYTITSQTVGSDRSVDSDIDATGKTSNFTLSAGDNNLSVDAGMYVSPATLGDKVWLDVNQNGIQDSGENGFANVTVKLYNSSNTLVATTTTDANGAYGFATLAPGTYSVIFAAPSGYSISPKLQGSDAAKDSDPDPSTGQTANITLTAGQNNTAVDAGMYVTPATLGDKVWLDANKNGIQDAGENGLANVTVKLYNNSSVLVGTTTTDANGAYGFSNIAPGTYSVTFTAPSGYTISPKLQGSDATKDSDPDPSTGQTASVTLTAGQNNTTIDAGLYVTPATLGDKVWLDANKNGIQDGGESGFTNITVKLYDNTNTLAGTTTTDANGIYGFSNLTPGNYSVLFVSPQDYSISSKLQGSDITKDSDPDAITGKTASITLTAGQNNTSVDAGMYSNPTASIGDKVWLDANQNGIQDAGENGIANVTVKLYNSSSSLIATTTTDESGIYGFTCLPTGTYTVQFTLPSGYTSSAKLQGSDISKDSDADPVTGMTANIALVSGQNNSTVDAGMYFTPASIGDKVWLDANQNGIQDAGENGLANVTVKLYNSNSTLSGTTTTDANGAYGFSNIAPGTYSITFTAPADYTISAKLQGSDAAKDSDPNPSTGQTASFTLTPGQNNTTIDAGMYVTPASLGDKVWLDANKNGVQEIGENGLANVQVELHSGDVLVRSTTTDANGIYGFSNLTPGSYYVMFFPPSGYTISPKSQGSDVAKDSDPDPSTRQTASFTLTPGQNNTTLDAGMYVTPASIGDKVWLDVNRNGIQDSGENGIPNITVKLYDHTNTLVETSTTDVNGNYDFSNLAPGTYSVEFTAPSGCTISPKLQGSDVSKDSDPDPVAGKTASITLTAGQHNTSVDAGMYVTPATLGDKVWFDVNRNGIQEAGENGFANITVSLHDNSNVLIGTTTTDTNGFYGFANLAPGSYSVIFTAPLGYSISPKLQGNDVSKDSDPDPSTGKTAIVTLTAGQNNTSVDAGIYVTPSSLGDRVWLDNNENGKQDAQEPGVKGITIELHSAANNSLLSSTVTDSLGEYHFKDLSEGTYYVKVVIGSEHTFSPAHQAENEIDSDIDPATGKSDNVTLSKGENVITVDAGIFNSKVSLGDLVWNDANHNGIQDNGDAGIPNLTVSLYDNNDVFIATTTTDADGKYSFKNINAGNYKVQFSLPAGFTFTQPAQGSDAALNSDADPVTGKTSTISLSAGTNDMTWDAGMYLMSASVGDKVWNDLNQNGLQDFPNSELGIANVVVKIYTSTGTLVSTTLTDIAGEYKFSNLQPADYFIKFYAPEGHRYSPVSVGSDRTIDSDADPVTGKTATFTLAPGDDKTNIDEGMYIARASVGDFVWNDINKNGVQDNGEDGLAEITIRLYSSADALIGSTITDSHGAYEFTNLMPGSYYIKFFAPVDYLISPKNAGNNIDSDSDIDPSTGKTANLTLSPGEYNNTIDAGMYLPDRNADLSISKSSSLSVANDGSQITFTVTVTNNGPADATNISVSDLLQKGFVFVSATPDGEYNPSTGVWTVGNIAANGNKTLKISVKVSVADLNNAVLDLGPAKDYNMFVLEDLDQPSSDTQGKLAVGHDAHLTGYSVGDQLENSNGTEDVLVVGHDLYFGIGSIMRGNAVYGNHTNLPVNSVDILEGTIRKGHPIDFDAAKSYLNNLSAIVASQPANGTYTFEYKQLLMTGNDPYFNVFAVNGVDIAAANYVGVTVPNGSVVLINVSGENVSWAYGFEVKGTAKNNVLINFFEAKKLSLKNIDITGSILAPKADVDFTTGVQNGQMICKSYTGRGQMNLSPFVGNIPFSTTVINSAEVVSSDQNDPDSTPNNGLKTEDDYSEVSVVITNTNTESSSPLWKKTGTVSATQMPVSLTSESDGTLIAGTTNGGLFTTTNSGTSWTSISLPAQNGTVWGVDVPSFGTSADKAVSNEMIAATEKGVFMTTNGGSNWSASGLVNVDVRTVAKDNSGSIFAGTWGHGAYRSDDGGTMWVNVSAGLPSSTVAFSKIIKLNDGSVVAATFGNGMYRLSADKQSWTKLDFEYPFVWNLHQSVSGELYAATYGKGIFRSVNGGNTWQNISLGLTNLYIYAVSSDKNNNLAASSLNGGVFSMAKGKTNWSTLGLSGASVVSVAANPVNGQLVIASKNGSVMATAGTTGVKDNSTLIPKEYNLSQNYPNPFNPTTKIAVDIPMASEVTLMVYNILGQHIATLVNQQLQAGKYTFDFKANNFASGVYIYRLTAGKYTMTKKMILQK